MLYAVQKNIDHMHRIHSDAFIFSNTGKILLHKRKFSKLHLVHDLELHVEPIFKKIEILPVLFKYIFSLMNFIVNNEGKSQMSSCVHITDTRNKHHLYRPDTIFSCFQNSTVYAGITVFIISPCNLTSLKNEKAESKLVLR